jgi:hypothetical protein
MSWVFPVGCVARHILASLDQSAAPINYLPQPVSPHTSPENGKFRRNLNEMDVAITIRQRFRDARLLPLVQSFGEAEHISGG